MFKIHHIALSVKNIEKSLEFYKNFGFEKKLSWKSENNDLEIFHLKLWEIYLELFSFKNFKESSLDSRELTTDLPQIWVKHFWIQVENLEKTKKEFIEKNIAENIEIKLWKTGIKYFFIKDPDWILLEFVQDDRKL